MKALFGPDCLYLEEEIRWREWEMEDEVIGGAGWFLAIEKAK